MSLPPCVVPPMCARMLCPSMCAWRSARLDSMHVAVCDRSVRRRGEHARLSTHTKEQTRTVVSTGLARWKKGRWWVPRKVRRPTRNGGWARLPHTRKASFALE
eukprot:5639156-Prymnesium_polylepis.1